ncbi:MAG TPA: hypothetical protein VGI13_00785 [Candidatus Acidoferrum sp.]|jgi:hypothetical protein
MRQAIRFFCALCAACVLAGILAAQGTTSLNLAAHITPTGGRPEPVRQFTFYVLTKSYPDIIKEVEAGDVIPTREEFLSKMKASPELRDWMKAHDVMDLTAPDMDKLVTPNNVMDIPEFFAAYLRANSGGVTNGLPMPKFRESDKETNPAKYDKLHNEYLVALKHFIQTHPATISGIELELAGVNPKNQWDKIVGDHKLKVAQLAPDTAQTKYLAGKAETDLDGRAVVNGLAPGNYWVSSLGLDASSGDRRLRWDVPVGIQGGQPARIELTNLNGADAHKPFTP